MIKTCKGRQLLPLNDSQGSLDILGMGYFEVQVGKTVFKAIATWVLANHLQNTIAWVQNQ